MCSLGALGWSRVTNKSAYHALLVQGHFQVRPGVRFLYSPMGSPFGCVCGVLVYGWGAFRVCLGALAWILGDLRVCFFLLLWLGFG